MKRGYSTFVGIDLGGARGKTTAVAILRTCGESHQPVVEQVSARCVQSESTVPWTDHYLIELIGDLTQSGMTVCVAIDAPLTAPACVRCTRSICPGQSLCEDSASLWLESTGRALVNSEILESISLESEGIARSKPSREFHETNRALPLFSYVHRCTEIELHYRRGLYPKQSIGQGTNSVANRGQHLRKRLATLGFELNRNLIEVSPRATVHALLGEQLARGYKRDADPWSTRAAILEGLSKPPVEENKPLAETSAEKGRGPSVGKAPRQESCLRFSAKSRFSREQCLANDHCFEALLSAYTAYLYAREGWQIPDGAPWDDDGWIWAPQ